MTGALSNGRTIKNQTYRAIATIGAWGQSFPPPPIGIPPPQTNFWGIKTIQYFYGDSVETFRILRNML